MYTDEVKDQPLLTGTRGHLIRSIRKHSRQLQSQTGGPLGPIKTPLLGRGPDCRITDTSRWKDDKGTRTVKFTPLVMSTDKILMQIKDKHYLKWPRPLHSSPHICDKNKYCCLHKDHGHYTEDCRDLKEQIEELIQKGKLQKYVKKGEYSKFRGSNKNQHESTSKSDSRPH